MKACAECRFAEPTVNGDEAFIECRRYPPQLTPDGEGAAFPSVGDSDWCGEWAPTPDPA